MTNNPFIDWHRTNLENYLGVTNVETDNKTIIGLNVNKAGNGGGSIGLSSSALPADRFLTHYNDIELFNVMVKSKS
jgi:penicillin V acylase-like amidase (Ntn superfamily)